MKYVEENVLTNTDRFLEEQITGSFRTWHGIFTAVENEKGKMNFPIRLGKNHGEIPGENPDENSVKKFQ